MKGAGSREVQSAKIDNRSSSCPAEAPSARNTTPSLLCPSAGTRPSSSRSESVLSLETASAATNLQLSKLRALSHRPQHHRKVELRSTNVATLSPLPKTTNTMQHALSLPCTAFESNYRRRLCPLRQKTASSTVIVLKQELAHRCMLFAPLLLWGDALRTKARVVDVRRLKISPKNASSRRALEFLRKLFD